MIAAGGLEQQKRVGVGTVLQRSTIWDGRQKMDQIVDVQGSDLLPKFVLRAACP